jgi:3-oxoacyl-[acyl-carrier protein] reductase
MSEAKKRILITGALGYLGRNLVDHYLARGYEVAAVVRDMPDSHREGLTYIAEDLSKAGAGIRTLEKTAAALGTFDFLINNAAVQTTAPLAQESAGSVEEMLQVNLATVIELYSEIARTSLEVEAIVNITSIEAVIARPGHALYGASKAGLESFTRSAAQELAPIRSNALRLGLIERPGIREGWPEGVSLWEKKVPLFRMGTVTDVLMAVNFLLEAPWLSGSILTLDGGMSATTSW